MQTIAIVGEASSSTSLDVACVASHGSRACHVSYYTWYSSSRLYVCFLCAIAYAVVRKARGTFTLRIIDRQCDPDGILTGWEGGYDAACA